MSHLTGRYNFVLQLSEGLLNKTVAALFDSGEIPSTFSGLKTHRLDNLGAELELGYRVEISKPVVYLDTQIESGIGLRGELEADLTLGARIDPSSNHDGYKGCVLQVKAGASFDVVAALRIEKRNDGESFLTLSLEDLRDLDLRLDGNEIPEIVAELIRRLIKRVVLLSLKNEIVSVPLSSAFETSKIGGWRVEDPLIRVMDGPEPVDADNITVAMTTWLNRGRGRPSELVDWLEGSERFGVAVDQRLLRQTLDWEWNNDRIPRRFDERGHPNRNGPVLLKAFEFDLNDGYIHVSLNAAFETPVGEHDVWVHADIHVSYQSGRFEVELKNLSVEIGWVIHLLGFIAFRAIYLLIAVAMDHLVGRIVEEIGEEFLEKFLNSDAVPLVYQGAIPGTNLEIVASLVELQLFEDGIRTLGNVELTKAGEIA